MTDKSKLQQILDLAEKHKQRAQDNEDIAGARAQDARAEHFNAIRHNARLDGTLRAIELIRALSGEWTAQGYAAENGFVKVLLSQHATALDNLAFRLLSEVDES